MQRVPRSPVRRVLKATPGGIGTLFLVAVLLVALVGSWITPSNPVRQDLSAALRPPSMSPVEGARHMLGTDQLGRDMLSRVLVGLRTSLLIGLVVVLLSLVIGTIVGLLAGYYGQSLSLILMRVVDAQLAIPTLLLMIAVVATLGTGMLQIVLVLVIVGWPTYARVLRAEVLSLKEREYVAAAVAVGASDMTILVRHVTPNILPTVIVLATLQLPIIIIYEASLSFLGLGVQPPTPSLGQMLGQAQEVAFQAWWVATFPGVAISLMVLGFNLMGDGMRDLMDPRLRRILNN